jgi:hypothetical protein
LHFSCTRPRRLQIDSHPTLTTNLLLARSAAAPRTYLAPLHHPSDGTVGRVEHLATRWNVLPCTGRLRVAHWTPPTPHRNALTSHSKEDEEILKAEYLRNAKPDKAARLDIVRKVALGEKEVQVNPPMALHVTMARAPA